MTAKGHKPDCTCGLCRIIRQQALGAKTTKQNRVKIEIHVTREESEQMEQLAKQAGCSRKAFAEAAVRAALAESE